MYYDWRLMTFTIIMCLIMIYFGRACKAELKENNLCPDPSFESGNLDLWIPVRGAVLSMDSDCHSGNYALKVGSSAIGTANAELSGGIVFTQPYSGPIHASVWTKRGNADWSNTKVGLDLAVEFVDGTTEYVHEPFEVSPEIGRASCRERV